MSPSKASVTAVLQAAGYDVTSSGKAIHAHKSREDSWAYEVVVNAAGQVRFTATRVIEPARVASHAKAKRAYRITREQQRITTILYELKPRDDLAEVIREMEQTERE